ncbi:MAG: c-type cytochrome [Gammaproteobacteria bacterium]|nr:c-type cytochrome [Gammaproteobacteria bacterium]
MAYLSAILSSTASAVPEIVAAPEGLRQCVVCHGVELTGNRSVDAPNLSVLSTWYIERQLLNYKRGLRAPHGSTDDLIGREMQPMAAALDDESIVSVLAFAERVPERAALVTMMGDVARGAKLYTSCAACHGVNGEGNQSLSAPRLSGQSDWYLARQLENYQTGARGAEPGDIWGAQMRASVAMLSDEDDIDHVVSYINSLSP